MVFKVSTKNQQNTGKKIKKIFPKNKFCKCFGFLTKTTNKLLVVGAAVGKEIV
jgi:hypothetical protein